MQLYPILIVAIVLAADGLAIDGVAGDWPGGAMTGVAFGGPIVALAALYVCIGLAMRRSAKAHTIRPILRAGQFSRLARMGIIIWHGGVILGLGWLSAIRMWTGDLILIDELIAMLPPLVGMVGTWWVDYPIEKRLRDAMLIRRLDRGATVYPTPGRAAYVMMQLRLQMLPLLVPLLLIAMVGEVIRLMAEGVVDTEMRLWISEGATLLAAAGVFLVAPLLARMLLSVRRLDEGELRRALLEVCQAHRVKVREILVWDTGGVMINAAVMGLLAPLRYVLLTDAMLDSMDRRELLAVMAHEIGHVRRHHMPWMVLTMLASLTIATIVVTTPLTVAWFWVPGFAEFSHELEIGATIAALALAFVAFGWVSRRFERQADSFAAQHMSLYPVALQQTIANDADDDVELYGKPVVRDAPIASETITADAVGALQGALGTIAQLNMIDPQRRSWRHGSIVWRQRYLQSLIGKPVHRLAIDRVVARLKFGSAVVLVVGVVLQVVLWRVQEKAEQLDSQTAKHVWDLHDRVVRAGNADVGWSATLSDR